VSRFFVICLPPHSSHKMQPLDKAFMGPPKTFCCQEIEKMAPFKPRAICHPLPNRWTIRKYKQAATGATGLYPCDMNFFRPHDFPRMSRNIDALPVSHPALVKTSEQPSFTYANFFAVRFCRVSQSSDISPVPSLN
jgi:hypothetical protein